MDRSSRIPVVVFGLLATIVLLQPDTPEVEAAGPLVSDPVETPVHASVLPMSHEQTTTLAAFSPDRPFSCSVNVGHTVWYRLRSPATGSLVATTAGSNFDTALQVYLASGTGLKPVTCNDDWEAITSRVQFSATTGKVYYFQIGGWQGASGDVVFTVRAKPRNDSFANATVVKSLGSTFDGDTTLATAQTGEPNQCGTPTRTVWFKYQPAVTGSVTVDTFGSHSFFDTVVNVYRGTSPGSLIAVGCNDEGGPGSKSRFTWTAQAGQTYYIQLVGESDDEAFPYSVTFTRTS